MNEKKMIFNIGISFLTVFSVLFLRMETSKTSYGLLNKYSELKVLRSEERSLAAEYKAKTILERLEEKADGVVALRAMKSKQVVMVDVQGKLFSR